MWTLAIELLALRLHSYRHAHHWVNLNSLPRLCTIKYALFFHINIYYAINGIKVLRFFAQCTDLNYISKTNLHIFGRRRKCHATNYQNYSRRVNSEGRKQIILYFFEKVNASD